MFARPAQACSCAGSDPALGRERIVAETLEGSEAVFTGRMVGTSLFPWNGIDSRTVEFEVERVWKGPEAEVLKVQTPRGVGAGCGYPFERGEEYLVYADEGMSVSICKETSLIAEAQGDIEILGNPEWMSELPESGGGVSGKSYWSLVVVGIGLSGVILVSYAMKKRVSRD